jgi:hypothetical protein
MERPENCIVCQRSSQEVPLVVITFQGNNYYICPQDLPVLIHKPQQLIGKLPGVENLQGHEH